MDEPKTGKEMLDSINAAIYAIAVGGQEYKIGSRSLRRAARRFWCRTRMQCRRTRT